MWQFVQGARGTRARSFQRRRERPRGPRAKPSEQPRGIHVVGRFPGGSAGARGTAGGCHICTRKTLAPGKRGDSRADVVFLRPFSLASRWPSGAWGPWSPRLVKRSSCPGQRRTPCAAAPPSAPPWPPAASPSRWPSSWVSGRGSQGFTSGVAEMLGRGSVVSRGDLETECACVKSRAAPSGRRGRGRAGWVPARFPSAGSSAEVFVARVKWAQVGTGEK